jgi:predicted glycogen debranching enzyme
LALGIKVLVNYRDYHFSTHAGNWQMNLEKVPNGMQVLAFEGAVPFRLLSNDGKWEAHHEWHRDCFFLQEKYRGLDDHEDHLYAASFTAQLSPGYSITLVFTNESEVNPDGATALTQHKEREAQLLNACQRSSPAAFTGAPPWVAQLVLAADQFVVKRSLPGEADGRSILAGYPWFGDWGRDTMIALPGLTLATGRPEIAKQILLSFARYVDHGMLPNNFPDGGGHPDYNTVDAAFWYFEAVRQYYEVTKDKQAPAQLFPVLLHIIDAHLRGTRYNIHVDESDGLLYSGEPGVQLTWMDARVNGREITPSNRQND